MLGAPFLLTLGMGLVAGAFSSDSSSLQIPVAVINEDEGELGQIFAQAFGSDELADLLDPIAVSSASEAREMIMDNQLAAAVLVPPGFTDSFIPDTATGQLSPVAALELITDPARPISAGIVRSVTNTLLNDLETQTLSVRLSIEQLIAAGVLDAGDSADLAVKGQEIGRRLAIQQEESSLISINYETAAGAGDNLDFMAYMVPGFAVLFLMYTVSQGGRSILAEREKGTLARMLATPSSSTQIMGGKISGIFLSGLAQMSILILVSSILFDLRWGGLPAVTILLVAVVAAASGWGILLAAVAKNTQQVSSMGTAVMLIFGVLGGSFFALPSTGLIALVSKITPNAWAIEGFTTLAAGGSLADIANVIIALLLMALILFAAAGSLFRRRPLSAV